MSEFSEKCKELLTENGTNVYRLSSNSSLERTALQRMVTGKRLPNLEFVKSFCSELRLPHSEELHLLELYKIEQMGKETYENRKCIKKIFSVLAEIENKSTDLPLEVSFSMKNNLFQNRLSTNTVQDTELFIYSALAETFYRSEDTWIYTNFPCEHSILFKYLKVLHFQTSKKVPVTHLISFQMNSQKSITNLENLLHVFPFTLSNSVNYTPYYYYSKITPRDLTSLSFPYYIITPYCVLTISADFSSSLAHTNAEIIHQYAHSFEEICGNAYPFILTYATLEEAWQSYAQSATEKPASIKVWEPQICFLDMMDSNILSTLMQHLSPELRQIGNDIMAKKLEYSALNVRHYYSRYGIDLFAKTGCFIGQIGAFLPPLSPELRVDALQRYLNRPQNHQSYILKDNFTLPKYLNFELYDNQQIHVTKIDEAKNVSFFRVKESSIYDAFVDFEASLPDSEFVYSAEEEKRLILNYISFLKNQQ